MRGYDFTDSALVLIGHGTSLDAGSGGPVYAHAAELRKRELFTEVREAFWKQEPSATVVLSSIHASRIFIVPFFASEGYFCERIIPQAFGFAVGPKQGWNRVRSQPGQTLYYCRPVGTHPETTRIALHRADEVVRKSPLPFAPAPAEISLFIAGHGTPQDDNSRQSVESLVERVRAAGDYAQVEAVFLEEEPRVSACYGMARTRDVVLVPFFTGEGPHVKFDIPVLLGLPEAVARQRLDAGQAAWTNPTEKHTKRVWVAQSMGDDSRMVDVVLERVREAAEWPLPMGHSR